jgi:hypothetical protein
MKKHYCLDIHKFINSLLRMRFSWFHRGQAQGQTRPFQDHSAQQGGRLTWGLTIAPTSIGVGCFGLGLILGIALPLKASEASKTSNSKPSGFQYNPPIPPNLGAPKGRTGGGASRGTCAQYATMQAVVPRSDRPGSTNLTVSDRPTFWFYLPERPSTENLVEFVLQDSEDRYVYKTVFTRSNPSPELISVTVPEKSPALASSILYHWTLSIQCNPSHPSQVAFIRGSIQKVAIAPALNTAIQSSAPDTAARLYTERGLWYDAMTVLAQTMQIKPVSPSTQQLWRQLLAQAGLAELQPPAVAGRRTKVLQLNYDDALIKSTQCCLQ